MILQCLFHVLFQGTSQPAGLFTLGVIQTTISEGSFPYKVVIIFHCLSLQHMSLSGSVPEDHLCSRHILLSLSLVAVFLVLFDNIISLW